METEITRDDKFEYIEAGTGHPIVLLHGLMGGLSNFGAVISHFSSQGFRVLVPVLPLYTMPLLTTNVKSLARFLDRFLVHKGIAQATLIGNSLGGHVALIYTKLHPERVHSVVLTGSSGLYESAMGDSFPRRGDFEYVKKKTQEVFYNPEVATEELIQEVFGIINDRTKLIHTLAISKSAIRHNMTKDIATMTQPFCLVWGRNDNVTPPDVAERFHELLPNAELHWIDHCGHAAMMEHPEAFNRIVEDFLRRHIPA
jgi:pimeloyl-ACP methyl ester carboxylesterase